MIIIALFPLAILRFVLFKEDFLIEVDGNDLQSIAVANSCPADGVDCLNPATSFENLNEAASDKDGDDDSKERACDSLIMCIITTLNQGLRNGGGIGDVLRAPSSKVEYSLCFGQSERCYQISVSKNFNI